MYGAGLFTWMNVRNVRAVVLSLPKLKVSVRIRTVRSNVKTKSNLNFLFIKRRNCKHIHYFHYCTTIPFFNYAFTAALSHMKLSHHRLLRLFIVNWHSIFACWSVSIIKSKIVETQNTSACSMFIHVRACCTVSIKFLSRSIILCEDQFIAGKKPNVLIIFYNEISSNRIESRIFIYVRKKLWLCIFIRVILVD